MEAISGRHETSTRKARDGTYDSTCDRPPCGNRPVAGRDGPHGFGPWDLRVGLAWDFYVHEIVRDVGEVESIFATPHLVIFAGLGITALGFLLSIISVRFGGQRPVNPA